MRQKKHTLIGFKQIVAASLYAVFALCLNATWAAEALPPTVPMSKSANLGLGPTVLPPSKPDWKDLTSAQRITLAPLQEDWAGLGATSRRKWIEIANRYPSMSETEQQRLQERMKEWAKFTPEQRRAAREAYLQSRAVSAEQKQEKWQSYQQLPAEEKGKLASKPIEKPISLGVGVRPSNTKPTNAVAPGDTSHRPVLPQPQKPLAPAQ